MKTGNVFVALLFAMSCSKPVSTEMAHNEASVDSTAAYDITYTLNEGESEYRGEENASDEETNEESETYVEDYYDEASQLIMDGEESFYQISISNSGDESDSDVTWYFDKEFSLRCYKNNWSMEGQEGSKEFYLRNDSVICVLEVEPNGEGTITTRVCTEVGGKKTTVNTERVEAPVIELVPVSYLNTQRMQINEYVDGLRELLRGLDIPDPEAEMYEFKIGEAADDVGDYSELTTITIPKALYEKLMK